MRVLIVGQYFWPESFRVNDLVQALVERGHRVTVLTGWPNYPEGHVYPEFRQDPDRYSEFGGARVVRVPLIPRGRGSLRLVLNFLWFVVFGTVGGLWKLRREKFDTILVYQPSPITQCIPAIVLGWQKRAPVLLWTLDLWPETLRATGAVRNETVLRTVGALVSWIYRRCTLVLGQSRVFEASVSHYAGGPQRFRYFPQWAEPAFDKPLSDVAPAAEVAAFATAFNVLFAGNIGEAQGFPAILDAAERLRDRTDINWIIVGDGRNAQWVRDEVARRNLSSSVHLVGRFPTERMPSFFAVASVLLVSLKRDDVFSLVIPGKVQTYLAAGIPVVGMLDGEGARVIEEAGAGVTGPADDAESLARNIEAMAALSVSERARMGARGRQYAAVHFDRDTLVTTLESWFSEAIAEYQRN